MLSSEVNAVKIPMNNRNTGVTEELGIESVIDDLEKNLQPCLEAALKGAAAPVGVEDADFLMQPIECYDGAMCVILLDTRVYNAIRDRFEI